MRESPERRRARGGWYEDLILGRISPPFGPRNAWSSLAYGVVGVALAVRYQDDAAAVLAAALIILATGSWMYHWDKTIDANRMDWLGMMATFGAMAPFGWLPTWPGAHWVMLAAAIGGGWWYLYRSSARGGRRLHFDVAMAVLLVVGSIYPALHGALLEVGVSWAVFAVSYGVWWLDKRGSRLTGLWGHAFWHVGTAAAIGVLHLAQRAGG